MGAPNVETENFSYSRKETTSYMINSSFPNYFNTNLSLTNACANVAGANVVAYYDRYYDELIPNCSVGVNRSTGYTYFAMTVNKDKKQSVIDSFYKSMKTNTKNNGTTQEDFENGLKEYVQSQGRNLSYISVMSNGEFSFNNFDIELHNGRPVVLFLSGYNFASLVDLGNQVRITTSVYAGNHIIVAYGYQKVDYYNSDNVLIKSNTYMYVSTGIENINGYYLLNNGGKMISAEAVAIY
ncbi:MAG: hypothetical protein K2G70_03795 [Turicibacter sp.]|nr:hypothetical protein [Turicibacter sp.]